jgi:microcystin-dependent protein
MLGTTNTATDPNPTNNVVAEATLFNGYIAANPTTAMSPLSIGPTGGSQPHNNFQPYLCVDFIISLFGIFPPPS